MSNNVLGPDGLPVEDMFQEGEVELQETLAESGKTLFSPSRILLFMSCRNKYKEEYMNNNRSQPSGSAGLGLTIHSVLEEHFTSLSEFGKGFEPDEIKDVFSAKWSEGKEKYRFEEDEHYNLGCEGEALVTSKSFLEWIEKRRPKRSEFVTRKYLPGREYGVFGYVDLEEEDGTLVDFKTSARSPTRRDGEFVMSYPHSFQTQTYAYCERDTEAVTRVDYIVRKKRNPEVISVEARLDKGALESYQRQADIWIQAMMAEMIYPPNRSATLCNPKYCGAYAKCHSDF